MGRYNGPKRNVHKEIVDKVIARLENGVAPWVKPWKNGVGGNFPHNGNSGRRYRGVNVILLWMAPYSDPRWFTFKGVKKLGGSVRKGEKGTDVVFFKMLTRKETNEDGEVVVQRIPFLRGYKVFNAEQCEGLPERVDHDENDRVDPQVGFELAAQVVEANGVEVSHGGDRACYIPSMDRICMPDVDQFEDVPSYWSTMLHEEVHSTGAESRLNREFGKRFGSEEYAFEELIAEMGSAFLCTHLQVEGKLQHEEYIGNWIEVLRNDKWALWTASREAERASDYLLKQAGIIEDEEDQEQTEAA